MVLAGCGRLPAIGGRHARKAGGDRVAAGMFLKLAGIAGELQDAAHKGEIDILGWSWGVSETPPAGGGSAAGKPNFREISVQNWSPSRPLPCSTRPSKARASPPRS